MIAKNLQLFVFTTTIFFSSAAFALPFLQLDASGGIYDTATETVTATTQDFTLYALIQPPNNNKTIPNNYYISIAIEGLTDPSTLGSFSFGGTAYSDSDLTFGTPGTPALPSHGIFDAYYVEVPFTLDTNQKAQAYNVQDSPGGFSLFSAGKFLYYEDFLVQTNSLSKDLRLHFDLYTYDGETIQKAPFSHDAQSGNPVPEPATILLFGAGLAGLAGVARRKKR